MFKKREKHTTEVLNGKQVRGKIISIHLNENIGTGFPSKQLIHTPFQPWQKVMREVVEPPRPPARSDLYINYSLYNNQRHFSKFARERKLCIHRLWSNVQFIRSFKICVSNLCK